MSSNSFGKLFTVTTFGESHGPAIGCVIDGCPPGLAIAAEEFRYDLERRATGRSPSHAAVAVTTGLMQALSREELAGVIAHELAHIRHRDTLTMTVTATMAGAISMLANFALFFGGNDRERPGGVIGTIALMILAPLAAGLVQMAISRSREYEADRIGAEICGQPLWLAQALQKIEALARRVVNPAAERNPAMAHLFIINPLNGQGADNLFATHPSTANRVAALMQMAGREPVAAPTLRSGIPRAGQRRGAAPWR